MGRRPAEIGIELRWVSFPPHPLNTGGWGAEQCTGRVLQSGGRGVPCWRDPRVPLQLVGASTTSNQPSLPSSWRGEWANKTSDSSNSNQSSHPTEPVHCVKIQIKSLGRKPPVADISLMPRSFHPSFIKTLVWPPVQCQWW